MSVTINGSDSNVSAPAIAGTSSTAGVYFPSANVVAISTASTQRAVFDASGNFQFNSGYGSVATAYGCRAWVNFNGTGTVAIRASGNVSSITDNNTGDYTVNFTTALPDANYSLVAIADDATGAGVRVVSPYFGGFTTSGARIRVWSTAWALADSILCNVAVFR